MLGLVCRIERSKPVRLSDLGKPLYVASEGSVERDLEPHMRIAMRLWCYLEPPAADNGQRYRTEQGGKLISHTSRLQSTLRVHKGLLGVLRPSSVGIKQVDDRTTNLLLGGLVVIQYPSKGRLLTQWRCLQ